MINLLYYVTLTKFIPGGINKFFRQNNLQETCHIIKVYSIYFSIQISFLHLVNSVTNHKMNIKFICKMINMHNIKISVTNARKLPQLLRKDIFRKLRIEFYSCIVNFSWIEQLLKRYRLSIEDLIILREK